jgi:hypothetical protein
LQYLIGQSWISPERDAETNSAKLQQHTLTHSFRRMARQRMGYLMTQDHCQSGFVSRRAENAGVNGDLATRHGESIHRFRIVNDGKLPLVVGFVCCASDSLADLAHDPFGIGVVRHHAIA